MRNWEVIACYTHGNSLARSAPYGKKSVYVRGSLHTPMIRNGSHQNLDFYMLDTLVPDSGHGCSVAVGTWDFNEHWTTCGV